MTVNSEHVIYNSEQVINKFMLLIVFIIVNKLF